ncbi:hypothetical protein ASE74_03320 [Pedobacter sp. Leaf216]|nr:hypothetical protein ASE74_03320 [Pedobacter sp. Leaf216]
MGIAMCFNQAKAQNNPDKVYDFTSLEKTPDYPGGIKKFYEYLGREIKYPEVAKRNSTQGKVFVSFVVEKDGQLTDVKVTRSLTPETDAEALRVLEKSPRWNPGLINGRPVRVKYNINVNFSMK